MGNEATCECEWNGSRHNVKALLESPDLILRGEIRRRLPFAELKQIRANGDRLSFLFQGESVALALGVTLAPKWARILTSPPPSLAKKLGISADTAVRMIGPPDDPALQAVLSAAKAVTDKNPDLILARISSHAELTRALRTATPQVADRVPIWFIYPKGRGQSLTENEVRSTALATGIVDTKVCAVSPKLTGLRFIRRREK